LLGSFNPFKPSGVKWLHFSVQSHTGLTHPFNFFDIWALWHAGLITRVPGCQKIKRVG